MNTKDGSKEESFTVEAFVSDQFMNEKNIFTGEQRVLAIWKFLSIIIIGLSKSLAENINFGHQPPNTGSFTCIHVCQNILAYKLLET